MTYSWRIKSVIIKTLLILKKAKREGDAPTNRYKDEETSDLRKKVLEHFIETQKGVIEKHKDDTSEEGQEKLKKAQQKLAEFEKQLEALND